jgi:hypothetical protein
MAGSRAIRAGETGRYEVILYGSGSISMSGDGPWKNGTKTTHKTWVPSVLAAFFRAFMSASRSKDDGPPKRVQVCLY